MALAALLPLTAAASALVEVPLLPRTPRIDGKVEASEVEGVTPLGLRIIGSFDKPKQDSEVFCYFTEQGLYIGFRNLESNPDSLVLDNRTPNTPVYRDDSVQVFICAQREITRHNYFHFAVNAAGVPYSNNSGDDKEVIGWLSAASRTDRGWDAEFFIPFDAIDGRKDIPFWRANFGRVRPPRGEEPLEASAWSNPATTMHNFQRFGFMRLLPSGNFGGTAISQARPESAAALTVLPAATPAGGNDAATTAPAEAAPGDAEPGTTTLSPLPPGN